LRWIAQTHVVESVRSAARLSLRLQSANIPQECLRGLPPLQYTLCGPAAELDHAIETLSERVASGDWPHGALALDLTDAAQATSPHAYRRLLATWPASSAPPIVLRGPRTASRLDPAVDGFADRNALQVAAALGSLLADGVGDAVQLWDLPQEGHAAALATEILQATRARLAKADFIACPSCGRTQFDLQTTTARIEARLKHLKGLKIAVMGCIVNGPGEMADADFGYVGSGPGKIDLYVGKERVERNLPQGEAVDRLVELIRSRGLWVEPVSVS
jgi:(E)-4-hydroxy-3-methylbut-2-enyl-diphosphate synthase